ncbi:hypothetical protein OG352_36515 [Streptomyces sp. NBC_01485]|uniref:hypothetical protein n=1 Tax=Streptomyces sp. NBC_01485 TaxID=2903884 RepID=UPI002E2F1387|nr:hypothetical protein [Streptomyces sp. NBC_01485]
MARISIDYDLMYVLARQVWHLRDELDVTSKSKHAFAASDIGPRKQTAEALNDFYGDWQKSFGDAWQVMTDLGNLLDEIGKAFYDQDASFAVSGAQQAAFFQRKQAEAENDAYQHRNDSQRKEAQADRLRVRYGLQEQLLARKQAELESRRGELEKEQAEQQKRQEDLDGKGATLSRDELLKQQQALWQDQARTDEALKQLDKDEEPLRQQAETLQKNYADDFGALNRQGPWTPESGDPDPLSRNREYGGTDPEGPAPPPPPNGFTWQSDEGTTTVTYQLDENGRIEVDKNGDPVETTTTITNNNGLVHSETYRSLSDDGDSVTTIRSADGSVRKDYVDASPEGVTDGSMTRYVTDEAGNTLQIWTKRPDSGWELSMDRDTYLNSAAGRQDDQQYLDRPPAYLTVEHPVVDGDGRPAGAAPSKETTTALPDGASRTDFTNSDGSVTRVVTTESTRYVAYGSNNEIREIWQKRPDGGWYLRDSITQHTRYNDEPPLGTLGINWQ